MEPQLHPALRLYLDHGSREHLEAILRIWSPAIDPDYQIRSALFHAILKEDNDAVRMILDAGVSPMVQEAHDPWYTPLWFACKYGRRWLARLFWQLVGPDGRFLPSDGETINRLSCLRVAAWEGHADIVADLLDAWDGWPAYETGWALRGAASSWRESTVAMLLTRVPYEANTIQDALKDLVRLPKILPVFLGGFVPSSPIVTTEENSRQQSVVRQLVDAGANPDGDLHGQPLLHKAACSSNGIGALKVLLEKGANPNLQDINGKTALHKLFMFNRVCSPTPALRLLLQHGASAEMADEAGEIPLHAVAEMGTLEHFRICLLSCHDADAVIHQLTSNGESHLHYATAGGKLDTVEFLLSRGLPVDSPNNNGWTPLICALTTTRSKSSSISLSPLAAFLLRQGASTQVVTDEGWSLLHALATYSGKWDGAGSLARELIARGTPLDKQARVLRSPSVTAKTLCRGNIWGIRMRKLAEELATSSVELSESVQNVDTTPLMWAYRTGAMDVFNAITEHWASGNRAGN